MFSTTTRIHTRILIPLLFLISSQAADAQASTLPTLGAPLLHFSRDQPPPGFTLLNSITMEGDSLLADVSRVTEGSSSEEQTIDLRVGLVSNDIAGLEKAVREISTPGNARYQKYLTDDEVSWAFTGILNRDGALFT
jgi:hypothetical protein